MNIEALMQNTKTGKVLDITPLILSISITSSLKAQPAKLSLDVLNKTEVENGFIVSVKINQKSVFYGYVFKISNDLSEKLQITAYDQMRYLKNKDALIINNFTLSSLFEKICKEKQLKYRVDVVSNVNLNPKIHENKSIYSILDECIEETLIKSGKWFIIKDEAGVLVLTELEKLKSNLLLSDTITAVNYQKSIDDDTYNQIKLVRENKKTKKRELYIVKDSKSIAEKGLLQYYQKVSDGINPQELKDRAEKLLKIKNSETKSLKLTCLGDFRLTAGNGVYINIKELENEIKDFMLITECNHKLESGVHTMTLSLEVAR